MKGKLIILILVSDYYILTQEVEGNNRWIKERGLNADSLNRIMIKEIDRVLLAP